MNKLLFITLLTILYTTSGCVIKSHKFDPYTTAVCKSTISDYDNFHYKYTDLTNETSFTSTLIADSNMAIEVIDENGNAVELENNNITVTQTLYEVEAGTVDIGFAHDLYPRYGYTSEQTFSYSENGETIDVSLETTNQENTTLDQIQDRVLTVAINGVPQTISSEITSDEDSRTDTYHITVPYTHQSQTRELIITILIDQNNEGYIKTLYRNSPSCTLTCKEETVFASGNRVNCDYSCDDGTTGSFKTEPYNTDAYVTVENEGIWDFYKEDEIKKITQQCSFAGYESTSGLPNTINVIINASE